ncbi:SAM-dependent methyltransferase [Rhizobium alvei]|uniref:Cyclopropane-fatty-acyl-phospholipid synthase family protein n=1 Tax=Rhizobium alvei TaxID=1132659 RepID=A0ABT8YTE9_9HYPH|nr:cyclopropane-fatty-acyl-phospholipid synthase family protein [Rhizobium alvei]MDO6966637.1 cyclopropane-fatty-acyl-phospholipid synthase family protein [Rhizobium alvei]
MHQFDEATSPALDLSANRRKIGLGGLLLSRLIRNLRFGRLTIVLPSGASVKQAGPEAGPEATIVIRRWRMVRRLLAAGDIGFAEAFIDGDWTTPDLTSVIRLAARNTESLTPAITGNGVMRLVNRIGHLLNANTKKGSRRNIEAHYDLGNDFYREWLDPTMLYSSAIHDAATSDLESAQRQRLDLIREKLALRGGERVLEIGCGWGALAVDLATKADAQVTGLTLSPSQLAWARDAAASAGKADQIDLRLEDYRDVQGLFDRIVSIEMFEAVGQAYWASYFDTLKRCLAADGRAVLQIISIEEARFDAYRDNVDFIQKFVFPGGFLPSVPALRKAVEAAGLTLVDEQRFGKSYAWTLAEWRARFHANWPAIAAQGFDERFRRLWHYYLCYCEAGFEEGSIDVGLYTVMHA